MDIKEIGFGDFCTIEQKRYVGPNEFYGYKVVGRKKSNVWTDVPVDANNEKETLHDHLDDVVTVVCNNLGDRTVHQFRIRDLASVKKAHAVPEWISTSDRMPKEGEEVLVHSLGQVRQVTRDSKWAGGFKERNCYGWQAAYGQSHWMPKSIGLPEEYHFYYKNDAKQKAMIEAQEQSHD